MQADFSVELGPEDETLTVPWSSADGALRYYDLKRQPDLLLYVDEASQYPELGEFLTAVNSGRSRLQTAKCDAAFSTELNEEEQIYGAACKFASYVDVFFAEREASLSFPANEEFARRLSKLLARAPDISAAVELAIRRAWFGPDEDTLKDPGYYMTLFVSGYGDDEGDARRHWAIAMKLVENAILQLSAAKSLP